MNEKLFEELVGSIKEAGQIHRGEKAAARSKAFEPVDVKSIREQIGLSQSKFALTMGVNLRTLQNWEQGRRQPHGPALALLTIFKNDPEHAVRALHG